MGIRDICTFTLSYLIFSTLRIFQLALALTVCGLYGKDLSAAHKVGAYSDGKWVYAVVVGSLSAFTAVFYLVPLLMKVPFIWVWDLLLWFMWIVVFGIFGNMYIKEHAEGDNGVQRMKNAVWVDLANMLLWFITAVAMAGYWWKHRDVKTRWTGRATV